MLKVRIARKSWEAEDVAGFELVAANGGDLPAFDAGAHIDVLVPNGCLRQYSLCNSPRERHRYVIGVLREQASRGGSKGMHEAVQEGDTLQISEPKNHFPLIELAPRSLLLAGGIGVTPILAMAERLHQLGRDFSFHFATRSAARTPYLDRIRQSGFADKVLVHHDDGPAEQRLDLVRVLRQRTDGVQLYVCGPKGFLDAVRATAADAGWPAAAVHFEYFAGANTHSSDDRHFEVELKSTGAVIRVEAAQTIVQALSAHGVILPVSCEQGVCGTCLTRVLNGEIEHKDLFLTPEEQARQDQMLPCCSRAKSKRLVLDL